MKVLRAALLGILAATLAACSSHGIKDPFEGQSAKQIYSRGYTAMERGDYETAIDAFQALEAHYPFGKYTESAQLNLIYAHYQYNEYAAAVANADRFIRLHPRNKHLDYVYYMRGLVKYNEDVGFLEHFFPVDPARRDVSHERESFLYFNELLLRYPNSHYSADARTRMLHLRNLIAQHELRSAEYYYKRAAYLASANRAKFIVEHFDQTDVMGDALAMMIKSYRKLGLNDLANDAGKVLALNFPGYTDIEKLTNGA